MKLDENLGHQARSILQAAGHDVESVVSQAVHEIDDVSLLDLCKKERRALVTLDLDFASPVRFLPSAFPGIVVLRLPHKPSQAILLHLVRTFALGLEREALDGKLWIVEPGRMRVFQEFDASEDSGTERG
ncbi:MAG: DUF5615 family PIN-like protein [Betaproteobacteria bacterium]